VAVLNRYIESHLFLQKEIILWDFNELAMPHGLAAKGQNPDFNRHSSIQILAFNSQFNQNLIFNSPSLLTRGCSYDSLPIGVQPIW
jgi:hypothetical protein